MSATPAVALHVGVHKTATTHLQQAIRAHRRDLKAIGVHFFGPAHFRSGRFPMRQVLEWSGDTGSLARTFAPGMVGKHAGARRLVISEENILGGAHDADMLREGRPYPRGAVRLERFLAAIGARGATLFVAVRNPADFITSAYSQRLLAGLPMPFERFVGDMNVATLSWSDLVARLRAVPGVGDCVVWRYEAYPAIAPRIMEGLLGAEGAAQVKVPDRPAHQGLSDRAQRHVMDWLASGAEGDAAEVAKEARRTFPKSDANPAFAPFDSATREASARHYATDLERLAALEGVHLMEP